MHHRFPILKPEQMTPQQRALADVIASGPRGGLKRPYLALIHHPDLANHLQALGEHLRFGTGLSPALVEIPILVTARRWNCDYEWAAHARIARNAGLADNVIAAIGRGIHASIADHLTSDEALLYAFAQETVDHGNPSDQTYDAVVARYSVQTALDLLALCGYYTLLAFVLNTADFPLPEGTTPLPDRAMTEQRKET